MCQPSAPFIGSATLQLGGRKKWTLIPGGQSYRLRPSLAPDGRAFFCTRRAHGAAGVATLAAAGATHYQVEQRPGDVLWVPTWTWHRVDYLPNVTALSVSLFHVRAEQLAAEVFVGGLEDEPVDDSADALCPEGCCAALRRVVPDGPLDNGKELITLGSWLTDLHPGAWAASQQQCRSQRHCAV